MICLGIGQIATCSIARHQLAFISCIAKHFDIPVVKFFDPVLSADEKEAIKQLNYEVLCENLEGKYRPEHPTLFYLPHCPKQITNNLLFANWNAASLAHLVLICNSFKTVVESTPERLLRPNAHYVIEASSFVSEKEIENNFKFSDIFNDFSVHFFESSRLAELPPAFWEDKPEPVYSDEDLELVTNGSS